MGLPRRETERLEVRSIREGQTAPRLLPENVGPSDDEVEGIL